VSRIVSPWHRDGKIVRPDIHRQGETRMATKAKKTSKLHKGKKLEAQKPLKTTLVLRKAAGQQKLEY
jgi:hypothetical protein